jgi:uncharacterized surface anchored protein
VTSSAGGASCKLTLSGKQAGLLTGLVLKPDGAPLVGAAVQATYIIAYPSMFGQKRDIGATGLRTDEEGRYNLKVIQGGTGQFCLAAAGYRLAEFEMEIDPTKVQERDVKLTAEKADAEIRGKILLPDGKPAVGVPVLPYVTDRPWPWFSQMAFDKIYFLGDHQAVATGSDGTFCLSGLRPGVYGLVVQTMRMVLGMGKVEALGPGLAGYCPTLVADKVVVTEGGRVDLAAARLNKWAKLRVTATDAPTGRPLANARLSLQPQEGKSLLQRRMGYGMDADAQGCAQEANLIPGKYNLNISAPNHQDLFLSQDKALVLESGQEVEIKVQLPPLQPGADGGKPVS